MGPDGSHLAIRAILLRVADMTTKSWHVVFVHGAGLCYNSCMNPKQSLSLFVSLLCACAANAGQGVFGEPQRVAGVGQKGMAVALDGKRLFAGAGSRLYALDASNPLKPVVLGELNGFDNLRQIRVRGNFVYVVSRETGMRIVDVSDPAHMRIRSRYDSVEFATGIDVVGSVAFLSERIYGVEAVDVSDPDNPAHIAIRKTFESQSNRYRDGWLFSGEWGSGELSVFDARDMKSFRKVASANLGGFGDGVELDGKYVYCSTGHDSKRPGVSAVEAKGAGRGLDIFDISDPASPKHVSRVDFPVFKPRDEDFWTPRVANGWAFCCDSHNGLFAVDVRDPANPKIADRFCIPDPKKPDWPSGAISSLEVGEGCLYVTCAPGGLYVVPVEGVRPQPRPTGEPPKNISYRERYDTDEGKFFVYRPAASGQARSVAMRGDVVYAAFGDAGLHVLRIAKDGGFEKLGELPGNHRVTDCCFAGDRLLVAEGLDGFALYELDGPAKFREVARRPNAGPGGSVAFWCWAVDAETVVLSARYGPYALYSIADFNAASPLCELNGTCSWDRYASDSGIDGVYPIVVPYRGLFWLKASGGAASLAGPAAGVLDADPPEQRNGVARFGDRFICTEGCGYKIFAPDMTLAHHGTFGMGKQDGYRGIPRSDGRLVLLTERSGRRASVWDFADPEKPKLLRSHRLSGTPDTGALFEGRALIPAGHQGLLLEKTFP